MTELTVREVTDRYDLMCGVTRRRDLQKTHQYHAASTRNWFAGLALLTAATLSMSCAKADDLTECVEQKVSFDGIKPLEYGVVTGEKEGKLYLHKTFPSECSATNDAACTSAIYILPGDSVAVGKRCGAWAYVQYIGTTRVTMGWVASYRVGNLSVPLLKEAQTADWPQGTAPAFRLTRGRGRPVCEAYLQRLNQTVFHKPPYCGRPESDTVPGFAVLPRVPLTQAETDQLRPWVLGITKPIRYLSTDELLQMNEDHGIVLHVPKAAVDAAIKIRNPPIYPPIHPWRYTGPLNINNDGTPRHVAMWDWDSTDVPCGGYDTHDGSRIRSGQVSLVVSGDLSTIDLPNTLRTFGHPDGGFDLGPQTLPHGVQFVRSLRLIGFSYGVFEYRGVMFFDTFFDANYAYGDTDKNRQGDFFDKRKGSRTLKDVYRKDVVAA